MRVIHRWLVMALLVWSAAALRAQSVLEDVLSPARLPYLKHSKLIQVSSTDTTGGNNDYISIPAGATASLANVQGPGVITQIWVTIASQDKYFLRRILLRMYWDSESEPSVEVPIGDFFGTGFQYKQYVTPYLGMSSGGYYCAFPMPFRRSARVEVVNETGQEINSFYYHVDYHRLERQLEPDVAYFHASWRREPRTDPGHSYVILEAEGQGHVVGVNMSMQSYDRDMQYLEGDEQVFVDGESTPSLSGTGTEDYFVSGWYFNKGEYAAPHHGLILKDDSLGRIAAYRFHVLDAIPFRKSIRFAIEHGDQNTAIADYSSTVYWYQLEPHKPFGPMPGAGMRIPLRVAVPNGAIEAESLTPAAGAEKCRVEEMEAFGADWSGFRQLRFDGRGAGDSFALGIPGEEETYDIGMYITKGPMYGDVKVLADEKEIGIISGYDPNIIPGGRTTLKNVNVSHGLVRLTFVVAGKHTDASGYGVGLDAFTLEPHRKYIPDWYMIGPFPNVRDEHLVRLGLDAVNPPEREFDPAKTYPGVNGKPVGWTLDRTPANGRMDLYKYDPYELVVVYACTFVHSPKDQTLPFLVGSDDGIKVFLNDKEIHRILKIRVAAPDQDRIPLVLRKGWNKLMLKIENNFGGYNFYARVMDPEKTLRFSPKKEF